MNWEYVKVSKLAEVVTDYVANGSFADLANNVTYKDKEDYAVLIRLVDYNNGFKGPFVFIDQKAYEFLSKSQLFGDEIIISNVGANVGTVFKCPHLKYKMSLAPNSIMVKFKGINDFYYYWLTSPIGQFSLKTIVAGSAQPKFNKTNFREMMVPAPDLTTQRKIAAVLSVLDDKIALNRRINAKLEQMAKRLYDYWFVQFDFPNAEGKPYKSSGGKMIDNPILKRKIPEGWEVKRLFDVVDVQYGFPFSTELFTEEPTNVPVVRIRDILDGSTSAYSHEPTDEKYHLQVGDVVVGMDGNFHMNFWHSDKDYLNQRCVRLRPKKDSSISSIQIFYAISPYIKAKEKSVKGSTVGHLSDGDIKGLYIIVPMLNDKFKSKNTFDSLLNLLLKNRQESAKLTALRDRLLPMLMNGQVTVK